MNNNELLKELESKKYSDEGWLDRLQKASGFQTDEEFNNYRDNRIAKDMPEEELKFELEYYLGRLSVLEYVIKLIKKVT